MKIKTLLLLSGGLDSTVLAADLCATHGPDAVRGIHFRLSRELGTRGLQAATAQAERLGMGLDVVELTSLVESLASHGESMLNPEFPNEWDTANETAPGIPTVMPAVVTASIFFAQMIGIRSLSLGLIGNQAARNSGLGPSVTGLSKLVSLMNPTGVAGVSIDMPYISMDKAQVITRGQTLRVALGESWSCLEPEAAVHCGTCAQCRERRSSFDIAAVPDPTIYGCDPTQ